MLGARGLTEAIAARPALVLGGCAALAAGLLFQNAGLIMDDSAYLERFLPALQSWTETVFLPPALRDWFGPLQRPLTLWSLQLDRLLWGSLGARGYHWSQALLFGAMVAAFTSLAGALLRHLAAPLGARRVRAAAWIAGLLFTLHPTRVETAAWLSTRADVLFSLFLLLALRAAVWALAAERSPRQSWTGGILAAALALLAVQAKETGYAAFVLLAVLPWLWPGERPLRQRAAPLLAPAALALAVCLVLRRLGPEPVEFRMAPDWPLRWLQALGWAFPGTLWPLRPRLIYDPAPSPWWSAATLLLIAVWAYYGARAWRRDNPLPLFLFLLAGVTLAPTWMVAWKEIMSAMVSDRYLLLPAGALFLLVAVPLSRPRWRERLLLAAAGGLFLFASGRYALAWAGPPQALARWTVEQAPRNVTARTAAILRVLRAGDLASAEALFTLQPAPQPRPDEAGNLDALAAVVHFYQGRLEDALDAARRAAEGEGDNARRWQEFGYLLYATFREWVDERRDDQVLPRLLGDARNACTLAIRHDERAFYSWETLGRVRASMGDYPGARQAFAQVVELAPGSAAARLAGWRSRFLPDPSTFQWAELDALQAELDAAADAEASEHLGVLLHDYALDVAYGSPAAAVPSLLVEEARESLEQAVALDPARAQAWLALGLTRATLRDYAGARAAFERVLALGPGSTAAGNARRNLERLAEQGH